MLHAVKTSSLALAVVIAAVMGLSLCSFAGSEYVVVNVDPPGNEPTLGKLFKVGDVVHIGKGIVVSLLGDDGSVANLRGPADILVTDSTSGRAQASTAVTAKAQSTLASISDLLTKGGSQVETIGASRSLDAELGPVANPWTIQVEDATAGCIRDGQLQLGREENKTVPVVIKLQDHAPITGLVWEENKVTFTLADRVPTNAKTLAITVGSVQSQISLSQLPDNINRQDNLQILQWMLTNGCTRQAKLLVRDISGK